MKHFPFKLVGAEHAEVMKVGGPDSTHPPKVRVEIHAPALTMIWDLDRAEAESFGLALLAACHRNLWPGE